MFFFKNNYLKYKHLTGSVFGVICGDSLEMPVEDWSYKTIKNHFGKLENTYPGRLPTGDYTDDTQMIIAILETFSIFGYIDFLYLKKLFIKNFEYWRGYGKYITEKVKKEILNTSSKKQNISSISFGNGGAMRAGIIGVFYSNNIQKCKITAFNQCYISHRHPKSLAGAVAQAIATSISCKLGMQKRDINHNHF